MVHGDVPNDLLAISQEPNVRIMETKALVCNARPGARPKRSTCGKNVEAIHPGGSMSTTAFLTDSTLCIGCKACEVACKEWNQISADGYDFSWLLV